MADDIATSAEACREFKNTVNQLMVGLTPIIQRYDKGAKSPNLKTLISTASTTGGITKLFEQGLTPSQKLLFAQAWAKAMDEKVVMEKFIKSTSREWANIEGGTEAQQERALLKIVEGLEVPSNGAQFLHQLYEKKDLLTAKEKSAIIEYFKACIYYAQMYQELMLEERARGK